MSLIPKWIRRGKKTLESERLMLDLEERVNQMEMFLETCYHYQSDKKIYDKEVKVNPKAAGEENGGAQTSPGPIDKI